MRSLPCGFFDTWARKIEARAEVLARREEASQPGGFYYTWAQQISEQVAKQDVTADELGEVEEMRMTRMMFDDKGLMLMRRRG